MNRRHCFRTATHRQKGLAFSPNQHHFQNFRLPFAYSFKFANLSQANPFIRMSTRWVVILFVNFHWIIIFLKLVSELDITGGDPKKVGYYAGLIVRFISLFAFLRSIHANRNHFSLPLRQSLSFSGVECLTVSVENLFSWLGCWAQQYLCSVLDFPRRFGLLLSGKSIQFRHWYIWKPFSCVTVVVWPDCWTEISVWLLKLVYSHG